MRDGKVELIDDSRSRVAHLQRWPDGLQAAVEAKEDLEASPTGAVLDRIVVQSLLGRYRTLCGMTGTAVAVAEELFEFYKLSVGAVDTNEPCIREDLPDRVYRTVAEKEAAIVAHVAEIHATGQPVLLGTQDVAESERLAGALKAAGVVCAVLNARNDAEEAAIIARAGERDRVTISTQMAGRGTDIQLRAARAWSSWADSICSSPYRSRAQSDLATRQLHIRQRRDRLDEGPSCQLVVGFVHGGSHDGFIMKTSRPGPSSGMPPASRTSRARSSERSLVIP